jgi:hypothetical protein
VYFLLLSSVYFLVLPMTIRFVIVLIHGIRHSRQWDSRPYDWHVRGLRQGGTSSQCFFILVMDALCLLSLLKLVNMGC